MPKEVGPAEAALWLGVSQVLSDKVLVNIDRANITPAPTAAAWSYKVPFRLIGEVEGVVLPYTGTVGVAAADTSSAGTASVPAATVDVVMGYGEATLNGDAAAWLNTEEASITITYTNLRGSTDTDVWKTTFTTP
jgi:hypothetical protein